MKIQVIHSLESLQKPFTMAENLGQFISFDITIILPEKICRNFILQSCFLAAFYSNI